MKSLLTMLLFVSWNALAQLSVSNSTLTTFAVSITLNGTNVIQGAELVPGAQVQIIDGPWSNWEMHIDGLQYPLDRSRNGVIIITDDAIAFAESEKPQIKKYLWVACLSGMSVGLVLYGFGWQMRLVRQIGRVSPEIP